jgi:hypothetical protein
VARLDRSHDWGEADLDLALQESDCPACVLARETEHATLFWMANANIRDAETIAVLIESKGLCGPHWEALLDRLGPEPGMAAVRLLQRVAAAASEDLGRGSEPIAPRCPICTVMKRRAHNTLIRILDRLDEQHDRVTFERSFGLCQPHLADALALQPQPEHGRALLDIQRSQLDRLAARLGRAATETPAGRLARDLAAKLGGSRPST